MEEFVKERSRIRIVEKWVGLDASFVKNHVGRMAESLNCMQLKQRVVLCSRKKRQDYRTLRVGKLRRNYERAVVRKVGWVASEQKWLRVDHALVWLRVENTLDALRRWVIMPWSEGVLCVCKGCYALMMGMRWYIRRVTERETCVSRLFVDGALGICITPSRDYALLSPAPKVFIE